MRRFEKKMLEPLKIEDEDEEVFVEATPHRTVCKMMSYHGSTSSVHQTSSRSVHSASSIESEHGGHKFVFETKESSTAANLSPIFGFKRKWSKRKNLKLR